MILLSAMNIGEIEFGLQRGANPDSDQAQAIRGFYSRYSQLPFDRNSIEPYALIRAELFRVYGHKKGKRRRTKETTLEELLDRVTGKSLGIDERDLIIAAIAVQYNCVLVTNDTNQGMARIKQAADALMAEGKPIELRTEDWRKPF